MKIQDLLYKVDVLFIEGNVNISVTSLAFDSREIKRGSMFFAISGTLEDGHKYIDNAIKNGASCIVYEKKPEKLVKNIVYINVKDTKIALALVSSNFYDNPSNKINLIGVTGTNGKTTIVNLLHQLFSFLGFKSGLLSTINNKIGTREIVSTHTTPDPIQINYLLHEMVKSKCNYCFMEVSSHAIHQSRITGLNFKAGIFSNITRDHLDYHKTFHEYIKVKKTFFDSLSKKSYALSNIDDKNGIKMVESTKAKKYTYSLKSISNYRLRLIENDFNGMLFQLNGVDIWTRLVGEFNAYNLLAVYAISNLFNISDEKVLPALSMLNIVKGRFQCVNSKEKIIGIVDYAHTDDALKNVLTTINKINPSNNIITVVGCGGDRDKQKRGLIASVACQYSSQVIFTADNPRSESADSIVNDMFDGISNEQKNSVLVILDRKQAIKTACRLANKGDVVLVAGKGHEKYQEINGEKIPFDDLKELKKELKII